jgi:hypothetical protein
MADLTFYPGDDVVQTLKWDPKRPDPGNRQIYFDGDANLYRAIVCGCYEGKRVAITARRSERKADTTQHILIPQQDLSGQKDAAKLPEWPADIGLADPRGYRKDMAKRVAKTWDLVETERASLCRGIVVVSGETGSCKTSFAREVARRHLSRLLAEKPDYRPHVVTYEDPIESRFAESPEQASLHGFEYTPREHGPDVQSLGRAVMDALRQRPSLFFVNEIRRDHDWRALLNFAGTGHFAITTTHAGSLIETFERLLIAAAANTPAKRSEIASRIVAIVHLKWLEKKKLVPALWVRTSGTRTALTQEGLASLLPNVSGSACLGRTYFATKLKYGSAAIKAAVKEDLNGR